MKKIYLITLLTSSIMSILVVKLNGQINSATGTFIVSYFFPESKESTVNSETWTNSQVLTVDAQLDIAKNWWVAKAPAAAGLSIISTLWWPSSLPIDYEPITMSSANEGDWINDCMDEIGYSSIWLTYIEEVADYNSDAASTHGVNQGYSIFIANSANDADHRFSDNLYAYAYPGGPFEVLTWGNAFWLGQLGNIHMQFVSAHETGHIFRAFDEYTQANYSGNDCNLSYSGYHNKNSEECDPLGIAYVSSIMRMDAASYPPLDLLNTNIDYWAQGMMGWNPSAVPTVNITSPPAGNVSGTISINVDASHVTSGIEKVEFYINSILSHTDLNSPYTYSWNTTTMANGPAEIKAIARSNAGKEGEPVGVVGIQQAIVNVNIVNKIWTAGATSTDWFDGNNWNPVGVPVNTDIVLINPTLPFIPYIYDDPAFPGRTANAATLEIKAGAEVRIGFNARLNVTGPMINNGILKIISTSGGVGSIIESSPIPGIVQRYFKGNTVDWHLVSSPIANATAGVFMNMFLQSFDPLKAQDAANNFGYNQIVNAANPLNVLEGYALYSNLNADNTIEFNGVLNTGNYNKNLIFDNVKNPNGWNLLGNPYPCSIDWNSVVIPVGMSNEVHYIEANTGADLSFVKGVGGTGSPFIPPMQGFFVSITNNNTIFTLTNAVKSHSGINNFYKSKPDKLLILQVINNKYSDELWIHFNEEAGEEHDGKFDAYKRLSFSNPELPQLYSITPDGSFLSVNGMPECEITKLGFKAGISGNFKFQVKECSGIEYVYLEDKQNGLIANLLESPYEYNYNTSDSPERFLLHFKPPQEIYSSEIRIISNDGSVFIYLPEEEIGEAKVYNTIGQLFVKKSVAEGFNQIIVEDLTGVYIVVVSTTNYNKNQKILLNN